MADCVFCQIVAGKRPAKKVGETTHVLAFRDNNPQAPTHILLIPKEHLADSANALALLPAPNKATLINCITLRTSKSGPGSRPHP